jgi:cobalt-zinc-cadmium efflux system outer membrane protein
MRIGTRAAAVCAAVLLPAVTAAAQGRALTLADLLALARERAPQIASARLAQEETRSRLLGASLKAQANPEVQVGVGRRQGTDQKFTDFEIGLTQNLEPGSRREARIAGAQAAIAQSAADTDETTRIVLRSTAAAFYRALHAAARLRLLDAEQELAAGVYRVADRRFKAGDIAVLDVNLARASLARVRAVRETGEAARALALGELRTLLGIEDDITVEGALTGGEQPDLGALLQAATQRPELRSLEADVLEAESELQLGGALSRPDYGVGARYSREEGDQILLGVFTVTLPVFSKGQALSAGGAARAARLRAELAAAKTRVSLEVRSAFDAYTRRLAAVRVLETDALPSLDENDALTTRSFDLGQIGLPELLVIRREILDTRSQHLDALLEAALARIDLDASASILR